MWCCGPRVDLLFMQLMVHNCCIWNSALSSWLDFGYRCIPQVTMLPIVLQMELVIMLTVLVVGVGVSVVGVGVVCASHPSRLFYAVRPRFSHLWVQSFHPAQGCVFRSGVPWASLRLRRHSFAPKLLASRCALSRSLPLAIGDAHSFPLRSFAHHPMGGPRCADETLLIF